MLQVQVPPEAAHFFFEKLLSLLSCIVLRVCLALKVSWSDYFIHAGMGVSCLFRFIHRLPYQTNDIPTATVIFS